MTPLLQKAGRYSRFNFFSTFTSCCLAAALTYARLLLATTTRQPWDLSGTIATATLDCPLGCAFCNALVTSHVSSSTEIFLAIVSPRAARCRATAVSVGHQEKVEAESKSHSTRPNAIAKAVGITTSTAISFRVMRKLALTDPRRQKPLAGESCKQTFYLNAAKGAREGLRLTRCPDFERHAFRDRARPRLGATFGMPSCSRIMRGRGCCDPLKGARREIPKPPSQRGARVGAMKGYR